MRFKNVLPCFMLCAAISASAAESPATGYFTAECLAATPVAEFRADVERALERARKAAPDIEKLRAALEKRSSPRLNAVNKRAEILKSLLDYASGRLAAGSTEMLLYSWMAHEETGMLLDYFEGEAKLLQELETLPPSAEFSVKTFGARGDGRGDDGPAIRKAVDAAIASGKPAKVFLPAGTYRIEPERNPPEIRSWINRMTGKPSAWEIGILRLAHLRLLNPEHLTLEGEPGTKLLFTDPTLCGVRILGGYHTTLRNLALDYETLPFTQGRIVAAAPDGSSLEVEIDPGFPSPDLPHFLQAPSRRITPVDPATRTYLPGTYPLGKVEALGDRRFRIETGSFRASEQRPGLKPGNLAVITGRYDSRRANAVNSMLSRFDVYDRLVLHSSPSFSFLLFGEAPILTGCRVEPPEGSSRLATGNGDGVMYLPGKVGPYLEECHFSSTEDDGINLTAPTAVLDSVSADGRRAEPDRLMRQNSGVLVIDGDTSEVKAAARVVVKNGIPEFSPPLPASVNTRESLRQKALTPDEQREQRTMYRKKQTARPDVCIQPGSSFGGSALVNCSFRNIRGLGVQMTAPSVWVENCRFDTLTGAGIDATALTPWGMYYSTHNSVIRDCVIRNSADGIRLKYIPPYSDGVMTPRSLTGIRIENNTVEGARGVPIHLENCSGVQLRNNRIILAPDGGRRAVFLKNFSDVTAEGNTLDGSGNLPLYTFADPAEKNEFRETK